MAVPRVVPRTGQESVWDYPRPPRVEASSRRIRIVLGGVAIVDSTRALRVLETSHPPTYYIPIDDIAPGTLVRAVGASFCEWKGSARYFDVSGGAALARRAAWTYDEPLPQYRILSGRVAFYAGPMDACYVDDDLVVPQPGGFYGGWITPDIAGPFKGGPGSGGW